MENIPDSFIIDDIDIDLFDYWLASIDGKDLQKLLNFAVTLAEAKYPDSQVKIDRLVEKRGFYFPILAIHAKNGKVYHENGENLIKGTKAQGAAI